MTTEILKNALKELEDRQQFELKQLELQYNAKVKGIKAKHKKAIILEVEGIGDILPYITDKRVVSAIQERLDRLMAIIND